MFYLIYIYNYNNCKVPDVPMWWPQYDTHWLYDREWDLVFTDNDCHKTHSLNITLLHFTRESSCLCLVAHVEFYLTYNF